MIVWCLLFLFGEFLVAWPQKLCQNTCCIVYERDEDGDLNGWIDIPLPTPDSHVTCLELQLGIEESQTEPITASVSSLNPQKLRIKVVLPSWIGSPPDVTKISVNDDRVCNYVQVKPNSVKFTWKGSLGTSTGLQSKNNRFKRSPYNDLSDIYSANPFLSNAMNQLTEPVTFYSASYGGDNSFLSAASSQTTVNSHQFFANNPFFNPSEMQSSDVTFHDTYYRNPEEETIVYYTNPEEKTNMNQLYSNPFLKGLFQSSSDVKHGKNNDVGFSEADVHPRRTNLQDEEGEDGCGVPVSVTPLVAHGMTVGSGAHPWLGAVYRQNENGLTLLCGSTLVSKKHVVTAAHCMQLSTRRFLPEEIWVVLGRKNLNQWSYNDGAQFIQAASIHTHPDFKGISYVNFSDADVAVIRLTEDVTFSPVVLPACLWSGSNHLRDIVGKKGVVSGWGRDESGVMPAEANELKLPVISEEDCLRSNEAFMILTSNRTFCAGYRDNSGPCRGDSGSGFMMKIDGKWALRGIVSIALASEDKRQCNLKEYVVFADVAQHLQWLLSILRK